MGRSIHRLFAIATTACLASTLQLQPSARSIAKPHLDFAAQAMATDFALQLNTDGQLMAARSGGRSGGGSFRGSSGSSSSSRSSGSRSRPAPRNNSSSPSRDPYYNPGYNPGPGPVIVPVPVNPGPNVYVNPGSGTTSGQAQSSADDGAGLIILIAILLVLGVSSFLIVFFVLRALRQPVGTRQEREINNDTVTISKIQVALLAEARYIQTELTKLSLEVDTDEEWGLLQLLQESALALLRSPENWSHVRASSQTVKSREEAEQMFNQLSIAERSKYTTETLTNVGGRVQRKDNYTPDPNKDPASYIVVTLLVGTADDRPLFGEVRTSDELKAVLEKLAAISSEYLMVFELIWTPQAESDSLTYDELLTEYTDMYQI